MHGLKVCFSKSSTVDGVWIQHGEGDVHVYRCHNSKTLVLGNNKNKNIKFTDPAIVLNEDGTIFIQRADINGSPIHTPIDAAVFADRLATFIASF